MQRDARAFLWDARESALDEIMHEFRSSFNSCLSSI